MAVVSFDIDGTLDAGDPPGPIPVAVIARARRNGHIVGSCSDRPVHEQRLLWSTLGLYIDFALPKADLGDVVRLFPDVAAIHVGDTMVDYYLAMRAGIAFISPQDAVQARPDAGGDLLDRIVGSIEQLRTARCPWPRADALPELPRAEHP